MVDIALELGLDEAKLEFAPKRIQGGSIARAIETREPVDTMLMFQSRLPPRGALRARIEFSKHYDMKII